MDLEGTREVLAERLRTAGIRAVTEPRSIVAPCALIEAPSDVRIPTLRADSATVEITVTLIAPANNPDWLMEHLVGAMVALGSTHAVATTFNVGDDATLPAYQMQLTVTVKET